MHACKVESDDDIVLQRFVVTAAGDQQGRLMTVAIVPEIVQQFVLNWKWQE